MEVAIMNTYFIHEANLERLEKRLTTIRNKCRKHGTSFSYYLTGNVEYRDHEDANGDTVKIKYLEVAAEGKVEHGPWEFVAVLEHHSSGNVIRNYNKSLEVPERYRTCGPTCEHCNKIRSRKDTYIIFNTDTQEFKQVGTGCLKEYTQGLDAEEVARYISLFDTLIQGEAVSGSGSFERYFNIREVLMYAFETVKHFGYEKADYYERYTRTTRERTMDYLAVDTNTTRWMTPRQIEQLKDEMQSVSFNAESQKDKVEDSLKWIANQEANNNYMNNLKVVCSEDWCTGRDLGILISLVITYKRALDEEIAKTLREKEREAEKQSEYLGIVGDKIHFTTAKIECIWSGENQFGISYLYKMVDTEGNIVMWSTDKSLEVENNFNISCSIKKLEDYKGVKQTWVTRCRLSVA